MILQPTALLPRLHEYSDKLSRWILPGYRFDASRVEKVIKVAKQCPHTMDTETVKAGTPFTFLDWQIYELLCPVYGIVHEDTGYRRFRRVLFLVPRKNGKSGLSSVLMIYHLAFDGEQRPMMYSIAKNRKQAGIVWEEAALMIKKSEYLSTKFQIYNSLNDKRILCPSNDGFWTCLSHDSQDKDGLNASATSSDEIQQYNLKDEQIVKLLHTSTSTRRQPMELCFGTMGVESGDVPYWKKLYDEGKAVLNDQYLDLELYPLIYEAPEGADIHDESTWFAANPSLGLIKTVHYMRGESNKAKLYPSEEGEFKRLDLNIATSSQESWIPLDVWDAAGEEMSFEQLAGRPVFLGIDMSETSDFTALSYVFPPYELDRVWRLKQKLFLPEQTLAKKEQIEKRPYMRWQNQGELIVTPGNVITKKAVFEHVVYAHPQFKIQGIAFDDWGNKTCEEDVIQLVKQMVKDGLIDSRVLDFWEAQRTDEEALFVAWGQGFKSMSQPTKDFLIMTHNAKSKRTPALKNDRNQIMRFMLDCVVLRKDPAGNVKPDKENSRNKIDGIVAGIMALGLGLLRTPKQTTDEWVSSSDFGF